MKKCPRCGKETEDLLPVKTGMKIALKTTQPGESSASSVCANCYEDLSGKVSQGVKLRMEQETREKNKMMMWKNRVNLIKQARQQMQQRSYSNAAVSYEKYLRVLEIVYNKKKGELSPSIFNNSKHSKELTVVASVYWDLMRIYDTNPRYLQRMKESADKLAEFLAYSTIYPDIVKKAEAFARTAKNPNIVRDFMRKTKTKHPRCFIATAAFGGPSTPEVEILRQFRDQYLKTSKAGRKLILLYYKCSPPLARWLIKHDSARSLTRMVLKNIARQIKIILK